MTWKLPISDAQAARWPTTGASVFHSDLLVEGPVGDVAVLLAALSSLLCDDGEDSHPLEQKQLKET